MKCAAGDPNGIGGALLMMCNHTTIADDAEAGAPEIEVTPAMIDAGRECIASVWLDFTGPNGQSEWGPVLTRVFREMTAAR
jgi:hypothetical protein